MKLSHVVPLSLLAASLTACALPPSPTAWNGQRGYGGSGDYGYDLAASRAEASAYRAQAPRLYPVPGQPEDPWGPYIAEAATRFGVPEVWIREVMRQESGGRLYAGDGSLITSGAGAMGLMQVMPATFDRLRARLGLGTDPYEPRDNIFAGTAYLKDMYDRFGSPYFLAAYNAGPDRVALYLAGSKILPDETENYVASIAPRIGTEYAAAPAVAAYALPSADPADRAFEGGGLVTPQYPMGQSFIAP
jgi:soluble lytic murein transglycosylase-like protein